MAAARSQEGPAQETPCPCGRSDARGRPLSLAGCCGPWLADFEHGPAPDPESLMRSRYTAFVRSDTAYLLATWHVSTRPAQLALEADVKWLGLEVRSRRLLGPAHGEVEFVARQRPAGGPAVRLHERSRFVREEGRWYYVDGDRLGERR